MPAPSVPQFPDRAVFRPPSDTDVFNPSTLIVYEAGDVAVEPVAGGNTLTFTVGPDAASVGFTVPVRAKRLLATGTTVSQALAVS